MPRGGQRQGAGRKTGSATKKTREIAESAANEGITPLEYLLAVMRDTTQDDATRRDAAKAAAPYIHPKLSAATIDANVRVDHESALDELEGEDDKDKTQD